MKKIITSSILLMVIALIGLAALVGCTEQESTAANTDSDSLPAMQPANHEGRFESLGANGCYGCHGYGELANPNMANAPQTPQDHYIDGSFDSKEYDPVRSQCITCHPVGGE